MVNLQKRPKIEFFRSDASTLVFCDFLRIPAAKSDKKCKNYRVLKHFFLMSPLGCFRFRKHHLHIHI